MMCQWLIPHFMNKKEVIFMSNYQFQSFLKDYFKSYIKVQESLGLSSYENKAYSLRVFDNYFYQKYPIPVQLSEDVVNDMLTYLVEKEGRNRYRYTALFSKFSKYLVKIGVSCYVPLIPKDNKSNFVPYIYSHEEISRIFKAVDSMRVRQHSKKCVLMCMPALLRVLYSTAIRLGEALSLKNEDVDLCKQIIILHNTKNGHERIAPINDSLKVILETYISYRNKLSVKNISLDASPFFVNLLGEPILQSAVHHRFIDILRLANIPYKGHHMGPRIHDLRHTACVHTMIKMVNDGKDIYCTLPYIAAYMGHTDFSSTNEYLRLSKEMFPDIIKASSEISKGIDGSIYNEIIFDGEDE